MEKIHYAVFDDFPIGKQSFQNLNEFSLNLLCTGSHVTFKQNVGLTTRTLVDINKWCINEVLAHCKESAHYLVTRLKNVCSGFNDFVQQFSFMSKIYDSDIGCWQILRCVSVPAINIAAKILKSLSHDWFFALRYLKMVFGPT